MKRGGFLKRKTPQHVKGHSDTATIKAEIQNLVRDIVIKRDGGCIFRNSYDVSSCNGFTKSYPPRLILQADRLITRANTATYADTRLIVCVCKGHHGWKKWHEREYNTLVKEMIGSEHAKLWERCEQDSWRPKRTSAMDWQFSLQL